MVFATYHMISVLIPGKTRKLLNRGWIPDEDKVHFKTRATPEVPEESSNNNHIY